MKKAAAPVAVIFLGLGFLVILFMVVPFIGFGGPGYEQVARDAAAAYYLDIDDYEVVFQKSVVNASGESVQGLYRRTDAKTVILIETGSSRPMVIATIFHEFAHAAQSKYKIDYKRMGYTAEQHAEVLSFSKLWYGKYWYNSLHLFAMHIFGKPKEYRATESLFKIAFTGTRVDI